MSADPHGTPCQFTVPVFDTLGGTSSGAAPINVVLDAPCMRCGGSGNDPEHRSPGQGTVGNVPVTLEMPVRCRDCRGSGWQPTTAGLAVLHFLERHARIR